MLPVSSKDDFSSNLPLDLLTCSKISGMIGSEKLSKIIDYLTDIGKIGALKAYAELWESRAKLQEIKETVRFPGNLFFITPNQQEEHSAQKLVESEFGVSTFPPFQLQLETYSDYHGGLRDTHRLNLLPTTEEHKKRLKKYIEINNISIGKSIHSSIASARLLFGYFYVDELTLGIHIRNLQKNRWLRKKDDKTIDIFPQFVNWEELLYQGTKKLASLVSKKLASLVSKQLDKPVSLMMTSPDSIVKKWQYHISKNDNPQYVGGASKKTLSNFDR